MGEPSAPELERVNSPETIAPNSLRTWNDHGYSIESYGQSPTVVVLGEEHTGKDQHQKQLELIEIIKPEYVLHELANGAVYDPKVGAWSRQRGRKFNFNDLPPVESVEVPTEYTIAADKVGFKIVGCELTLAEMADVEKRLAQQHPETFEYDEFEMEEEQTGILTKLDDPDWMNTGQEDEIIPYRDEFMAKMIEKYQALSLKPVIAVMGARHGDNIHKGGLLKEKGFGYVYVNQRNGDSSKPRI